MRGQGKSRTSFAILGFLAAGSKTGYEIRQAIAGSTAFFWNESYGQIYPMLRQLTDEGHVKPIKTPVVGLRARQKYAITAQGRAVLEQWLREAAQPSVFRNEMLLKLFFGSCVSKDVAIRHLVDARENAQRAIQTYENLRSEIVRGRRLEPQHGLYPEVTIEYGIAVETAVRDWAERMLKTLGSAPLSRGRKR